jgi:dienelactone hydrolase
MPAVTAVTRRAVGLCTALALVAAAACSSGSGSGGAGSETTAPAPAGPPYAVGRRAYTLVDTSRRTPAVPAAHLAAKADRTIKVELFYPATGEPGAEPPADPATPVVAREGAKPARGAPFPLVVFAHGFNGTGDAFRGFAERWARHGYAVALPTFPLSRKGIAYSPDYVNQPGDVSLVIDRMTGALGGAVDTKKVVVGGHSLGSATIFGVAYNSCCVDRRVKAVISVSGGPLTYPHGNYDHHPTTPLLLVHGEKDTTVAVGAGNYIFDQRWARPMWYLRPAAADHIGVFLGEPGRLFEEATLAFLDARLRGEAARLDKVAADVKASGAADWRVS